MLNTASLTLSAVGRVPVPGTGFSRLPFAEPDMTLMLTTPASTVRLAIAARPVLVESLPLVEFIGAVKFVGHVELAGRVELVDGE
jgi:hypothetical protein